MDPAEFRMKTRFVLKLGRALHECGTTSQRTERHLENVTRMLGLNGSFLVSPTTFEGMARLEEVTSAPLTYPKWINALSWALIGGSFSALLSSNTQDCLAAAFLSLVLFFITNLTSRNESWNPVITIVAPFVSALLACGFSALGLGINVPFVILSSIIIFVPGLALTVALTEISARHLISSSSRLVDSAMIMVKLFFGVISGIADADFLLHRHGSNGVFLPLLPAWKTWIAVPRLSLGLGIAMNIPQQQNLHDSQSLGIGAKYPDWSRQWDASLAGVHLNGRRICCFPMRCCRLKKACSRDDESK